MKETKPIPKWWHCDKHGDAMPHNAWGCPDCVSELRAELKAQAAEIKRLRDALDVANINPMVLGIDSAKS